MTLHAVILVALKASICLSVFAIGLSARPQDATFLLYRPSQFAKSFLAMGVIMPVAVAVVVKVFDLRQAVEVALVALAISPVPPLLPKKQVKADGSPSYAIGLLILSAVVAIVFIPVAVELLGVFFQAPVHMKPWPIARLALITVFVPLGLGTAMRQFSPHYRLKPRGRLA